MQRIAESALHRQGKQLPKVLWLEQPLAFDGDGFEQAKE
jgi:hypothetical protein